MHKPLSFYLDIKECKKYQSSKTMKTWRLRFTCALSLGIAVHMRAQSVPLYRMWRKASVEIWLLKKNGPLNKCIIGHYFRKKFIISMRNVGYMKSSLEHDWKLKAAAEQSLVEGKDLTGTHTRRKIYGDPRRWRSQFVRPIKEQNVPYVQTCVERMVCLRCRSICFLLRGKRDFPRNNFSQFLTGNNQISISQLSFHNPPSERYLQSATKLLRHCTQIG